MTFARLLKKMLLCCSEVAFLKDVLFLLKMKEAHVAFLETVTAILRPRSKLYKINYFRRKTSSSETSLSFNTEDQTSPKFSVDD